MPLFNENFYSDRERQRLEQTDRQLSLWIEDLTSPHLMSPGASLEEISDPQDFLPTSATDISHNHFQPYETLPSSTSTSSSSSSSSPGTQYSTSVASVDNVLDQSCLLSGGEEAGWGPGGGMTVTRLVPYRIKKIPQESPGEERRGLRKERQTKDEKMAKYHNLPYTVDHIINCNMEEFTDILNNTELNNDQLNLCRDIRKRGKNKVKRFIFCTLCISPEQNFCGIFFPVQKLNRVCYCQMSSPTQYFCRIDHFIFRLQREIVEREKVSKLHS